MRKIIFLFLLLCSIDVIAQDADEPLALPDSLAGRLREFRRADFARAEALDAAIMFYQEMDRMQDAKGYIQELSQLSKDLKDNYYIALTDYYLAVYALDLRDYEKAVLHINNALARIEMLRMSDRTTRLATKVYLTQSSCYSGMEILTDSYDAIQKGLEMAGDKNPDLYLKLINNLGNLYHKGGNSFEAERLYRESLKLKKSLPYRNLATIYCEKEDYDSALLFADTALQYSVSFYDSLCVKHFIGVAYLGKNDFDQADKYYKECLNELKHCSDPVLSSVIFQNSAYIALVQGDYDQALTLIDTAIVITGRLPDLNRKLNCIRLKAILLSEMQDLENSLKCMAEYSFARDSMMTQQGQQRFLDYVYHHETREIEQRYEAEKAITKQRQGFILIISALIILFTIMITIILVRNRRQKELLLKQELDLRNREVTSKSISKIQSNEILNDAIKKLTEMEEHAENDLLPDIIRSLKTLINEDARKDFDLHFVQIHPDFYKKLLSEYPKLTQNELRLCAFIKSNLSIKEIASINGISVESVKTARKRLRKSLNLTGEDVSLLEFLSKY